MVLFCDATCTVICIPHGVIVQPILNLIKDITTFMIKHLSITLLSAVLVGAGVAYAADPAPASGSSKAPSGQAAESVQKNLDKKPDNAGLQNAAEKLEANEAKRERHMKEKEERKKEHEVAKEQKRMTKKKHKAEKMKEKEGAKDTEMNKK